MAMSLGSSVEMSLFGESHGPAIGVVIEGLPPGRVYDSAFTGVEMARRRPGQSGLSTPRKEKDEPRILSGLKEGRFTGAPLAAVIENTDQRSRDYSQIERHLRPSHADFPAWEKYGESFDIRGGGRFSGRLTAPVVFAGSLFRRLLLEEGIEIFSHLSKIGAIEEKTPEDLTELRTLLLKEVPLLEEGKEARARAYIQKAREEKDSVGAAITTVVTGLPVGLGEPHFDTLEGELARALFSIGGIKAVSFGLGEGFAAARGSEVNDAYLMKEGQVVTATNHNGGALGGMSTGMPLQFTVTFKPTPSIGKKQETVDRLDRVGSHLALEGRHDPIIALRGRVVVENLAAFVLYDLMKRAGRLPF